MLAGVPVVNNTLYHRIRFAVGDSAVWFGGLPGGGDPDGGGSLLIVRDIEVPRAQETARADAVACAADFEPSGGLSGDRDTALAQAAAECLRRRGVASVTADRSLPFIFAHHLREAGIELVYDAEFGVRERRVKSDEEIDALRRAQETTMDAMRMACELIARSDADADGVLQSGGDVLTSERVRRAITSHLLDRGYSTPYDSIVATLPHVADCHHHGTGPIRTGQPVIIDIFPRDGVSRYWGDCTRTVAHGEATDELMNMHAAVVRANRAGTAALRPGTTGQEVHRATVASLAADGYGFSRAPTGETPSLRHGTGHGIGLDVHEPILLDDGAGETLAGEVFTLEPGLYSSKWGGVRVEDMVVVTGGGAVVLGELHVGLDWR